jgi:hypothetical protein
MTDDAKVAAEARDKAAHEHYKEFGAKDAETAGKGYIQIAPRFGSFCYGWDAGVTWARKQANAELSDLPIMSKSQAFALHNVLSEPLHMRIKELEAALENIKNGGGRAEVFGYDIYRCPQCASAEIAEEALKK